MYVLDGGGRRKEELIAIRVPTPLVCSPSWLLLLLCNRLLFSFFLFACYCKAIHLESDPLPMDHDLGACGLNSLVHLSVCLPLQTLSRLVSLQSIVSKNESSLELALGSSQSRLSYTRSSYYKLSLSLERRSCQTRNPLISSSFLQRVTKSCKPPKGLPAWLSF